MKKRFLIVAEVLFLLSMFVGNAGATDYTFGGDTLSPSNDTATVVWSGNYKVGSATSVAEVTGTTDSAIGWFNCFYEGPYDVSIILFTYNGTPANATFLDSTVRFVVTGNTKTRYSAAFVEHATIEAGTQYYYGVHVLVHDGGAAGDLRWYYDANVRQQNYYQDVTSIPADLSGASLDANGVKPSIRIFYSDGGEPPASATKKIGAAKLGAGKW